MASKVRSKPGAEAKFLTASTASTAGMREGRAYICQSTNERPTELVSSDITF